MPVRLNGSTSGYSELSAPAVAGNNTITLPTGNGTAGQHLQGDGAGGLSWGVGVSSDSQLCKAWVNFNGTGTVAIRASYNVSSITDNGTGDYTVNFTTAMADTNYSVSGNLMANIAPGNNMRCLVIYPNTTYSAAFAVGSLRVLAQDYGGGVADPLAATITIFR
jgi:hypothetical protein